MTAKENYLIEILRNNITRFDDLPIVLRSEIFISCQKIALHIVEKAVGIEIEATQVTDMMIDHEKEGYSEGFIEGCNSILSRIKTLTENEE